MDSDRATESGRKLARFLREGGVRSINANTNLKTIAISKARKWISSTAMPFRATSLWKPLNRVEPQPPIPPTRPRARNQDRPGTKLVIFGFDRGVTQHCICSGKDRNVHWQLRTGTAQRNIEYLHESFLRPDVSGLVKLPQNKYASWSEMEIL